MTVNLEIHLQRWDENLFEIHATYNKTNTSKEGGKDRRENISEIQCAEQKGHGDRRKMKSFSQLRQHL